jgi:hypothetical protein
MHRALAHGLPEVWERRSNGKEVATDGGLPEAGEDSRDEDWFEARDRGRDAWGCEPDLEPAPVMEYDGEDIPAVYTYPTHAAALGEFISEGDQLAVAFQDRAIVVTVDDIETEDEEVDQ